MLIFTDRYTVLIRASPLTPTTRESSPPQTPHLPTATYPLILGVGTEEEANRLLDDLNTLSHAPTSEFPPEIEYHPHWEFKFWIVANREHALQVLAWHFRHRIMYPDNLMAEINRPEVFTDPSNPGALPAHERHQRTMLLINVMAALRAYSYKFLGPRTGTGLRTTAKTTYGKDPTKRDDSEGYKA